MDPLECLARALVHIPDKGHVTTRYYGWYANRPRGMRGTAATAAAAVPPATVPAPRLAPTEASRRWAALLQQIFEVDPLACPACHGAMRIVAFITQPSVIDQILAPLRTRAATAAHADAQNPPSTRDRRDRAPRDGPLRPTGPAEPHPDAPITRGDVRCARPSHRGVRSVPAATGRPRDTTSGRPPRRGGGRRAGRCAPAGPRAVGDRAVCPTATRPSPIEIPIPQRQ